MRKRILSLLLCIVLCLSVLPMSAFAAAKLETPSNLHWDGSKALWDKVENASNDYRVTLYKNGTELFHGLAGHNYGRQFDTSMAEYGEGEYTFTVTALAKEGSDFIDSDESSMSPVFFFTDKMDTPTGLKWDNYFATWDAVADATTYEATLLKNGESCGCVTSSTCVADLSELITHNGSGTYTFSVVAYGPKLESNPAESPSKTINITPLPAPANLHWEGTKALWDKVENASNDYRVTLYKNGTELFHGLAGHNYGRQFDTSMAEYGEGEYTFTVQALPKKGQIEYGEGIVSPHSPVYSTYPSGTVKISFDANGGSVTPDSAETGTNGKLASLPTPTRSGYSFDGWYTMKEGGTKVDTNTVFTAAATIYAHWSRSFSFADLPETGVTNITVPEGDYFTEQDAKEAFILYWGENIKTDGEFVLIDYFDVDANGYHMWEVIVENDVISVMDSGYANLAGILFAVNNPNQIYDWWINGTYTVDAEDTPITSVTISGFENPAAGATAGSLSNLTVAADAPYELKTHSDDCTIWLWGGRRMKTDEAFAKNQQYNISTGLKAKDGYYFSDTCTYKLLDKSGNEVQIYAGIACEVPNAKAADIDTPAILLGESGPVTVYNIVLDPNGGSGERSVVIVEKGSVYTIPECSFGLPEGKADFAYWKASFADGSEKTFLPGEKWTADDIMTTLTAMWSSRDVPGLWLGETPVTDANKDNILGNTGTPTASFDSETNTLTLNHPNISGLHEGALIFAKNMNLTIKAADGLTLNNSDGYGIYVKNGSLTVEGNVTGTLSRYALMADKITVRGNLDFTHSKTYGATIGAVVGDIEIDGNVKLNATSTYFADDAIAANSSVRIDGDVTVSGSYYEGLAAYEGTVTMTSGQWDISAYDTAIWASDGISIPSGYTITTPAGGKISTVEIVEDQVRYHVTESDGTTVAKHVVIKPPVLTGITVTTPPDKTVYTAYEDFDPTGMVVTATYEDSSTKVVPATVIDGTDLKCSRTSVTVSYTEGEITKTAEQSITVNPGAITSVHVKNFMAPTVGNTAMVARNAQGEIMSLEYTPDICPLGFIDLVYAKCNNPDYVNAVKGGI